MCGVRLRFSLCVVFARVVLFVCFFFCLIICFILFVCDIDNELGSVIRITQIDPTPVIFECEDDNNYIMMRDRGWDINTVN